jgi:hypothetical protein
MPETRHADECDIPHQILGIRASRYGGKSRQASEDLCDTALARLSKVGARPQGHSVWIVCIAGC